MIRIGNESFKLTEFPLNQNSNTKRQQIKICSDDIAISLFNKVKVKQEKNRTICPCKITDSPTCALDVQQQSEKVLNSTTLKAIPVLKKEQFQHVKDFIIDLLDQLKEEIEPPASQMMLLEQYFSFIPHKLVNSWFEYACQNGVITKLLYSGFWILMWDRLPAEQTDVFQKNFICQIANTKKGPAILQSSLIYWTQSDGQHLRYFIKILSEGVLHISKEKLLEILPESLLHHPQFLHKLTSQPDCLLNILKNYASLAYPPSFALGNKLHSTLSNLPGYSPIVAWTYFLTGYERALDCYYAQLSSEMKMELFQIVLRQSDWKELIYKLAELENGKYCEEICQYVPKKLASIIQNRLARIDQAVD